MTTCGDLCKYVEEMFPLHLAEPWDNVGLLVGYRNKALQSVLLSLDITKGVLEEAKKKECQMILSHHPLIFKSLTRVAGENPVQDMVWHAIQMNCCLYSAHTNMDRAKGGMNDMLAETLKLQDIQPLEGDWSLFDTDSAGFGRFGFLKHAVSLGDWIDILKQTFQTHHIKTTGKKDKAIKKVACASGSFDGNMDIILALEPDIFVTGEMKYHEALDFHAQGIDIALIGHHESEAIFKPFMQKRLQTAFPNIAFHVSEEERSLFR